MNIKQRGFDSRILMIVLAIVATVVGRVFSPNVFIFAIAFFIIAMLMGNDFENFELGLMLVPCIRIYDTIGVSFIVNILLFVPILVSIFRNKRINKEAFLHTVILCVIETIHCITLNNMGNLFSNLSAIIPLYFCEVLIRKEEKLDSINIFRWLTFGILLSASIYLIISSSESHNILYFINKGVRFEAYASDPNYYSMYICIAVASFFISRSVKWFDIVMLLGDLLLGLITSSKMSLIVLVFIVVVNGIRQLSGLDRKRRNVFRVIFGIIVAIVIFNYQLVFKIYNNIISRMLDSSQSYNLAKLTTGRSTLFYGYLWQLVSNPLALLWGYGFQYVKYIGVSAGAHKANNVSHNTFLDIFLSWGVIGAAIFIYIIYRMIKKGFAPGMHYTFFDMIPLISCIICLFSLSCLSAGMFWYVVAAVFLTVKYAGKKKEEPVSLMTLEN